MLNKIVFLCINPWENILPPAIQGCIKECYCQSRGQALLLEKPLYYHERIEPYGETNLLREELLFNQDEQFMQILYVKTTQKELLEQVFTSADLVFVGMSGSKRECDKIFLMVLPWKEKTVFLWNSRINDIYFLHQLKREYKLEDSQIMEIKELPSYLTEALGNS